MTVQGLRGRSNVASTKVECCDEQPHPGTPERNLVNSCRKKLTDTPFGPYGTRHLIRSQLIYVLQNCHHFLAGRPDSTFRSLAAPYLRCAAASRGPDRRPSVDGGISDTGCRRLTNQIVFKLRHATRADVPIRRVLRHDRALPFGKYGCRTSTGQIRRNAESKGVETLAKDRLAHILRTDNPPHAGRTTDIANRHDSSSPTPERDRKSPRSAKTTTATPLGTCHRT